VLEFAMGAAGHLAGYNQSVLASTALLSATGYSKFLLGISRGPVDHPVRSVMEVSPHLKVVRDELHKPIAAHKG